MGEIKYRKAKIVYSKLLEKIEFGKHIGRTVEWVLDIDIHFIDKCLLTVEGFAIEGEVKERYDRLKRVSD